MRLYDATSDMALQKHRENMHTSKQNNTEKSEAHRTATRAEGLAESAAGREWPVGRCVRAGRHPGGAAIFRRLS
eukprot:COSAG01_NODE_39051_length_481_cov_3.410995_1_plen_73_part_10